MMSRIRQNNAIQVYIFRLIQMILTELTASGYGILIKTREKKWKARQLFYKKSTKVSH